MKQISYETICELIRGFKKPEFQEVSDFFVQKAISDTKISNIVSGSPNSMKRQSEKKKIMYLISGGIAAGKSTIAYGLVHFFNLHELPYLSSDTFFKAFYSDSIFEEGYEKARLLTDELLDEYSDIGSCIIWETVLSKEKKKTIIKHYKSQGYKIVCVYVHVGSTSLIQERAVERTKYGYHKVPPDFIADRQIKSGNSISWLFPLCDVFCVIDNSEKASLTFYLDRATLYVNKLRIDDEIKGVLRENELY